MDYSSLFRRASDGASSVKLFTWYCLLMEFSLYSITKYVCEPGSTVGIATDYGLDGPGSNPGGDEIFRPSRPALGPTQSPVQWVPDLSRG